MRILQKKPERVAKYFHPPATNCEAQKHMLARLLIRKVIAVHWSPYVKKNNMYTYQNVKLLAECSLIDIPINNEKYMPKIYGEMMYNNKKIIAIIPARAGSKGVPKKNIKPLGGIPLIKFSTAAARKSKYLDCVAVSSDSDEILDVAREYGIECIKRPDEFATDKAAMPPVLFHVLDHIKETKGEEFDYLMILQPTTPFRSGEDIDQAIEQLENGIDGVISVKQLYDQHPMRIKTLKDGYLAPFCMEEQDIPRQDLKPVAFLRNGSIYLISIPHFRATRSVKEGKMRPFIMSDDKSVNIDEPIDFEFAEFVYEKMFKKVLP